MGDSPQHERSDSAADPRTSFPKNAVVGIVAGTEELVGLAEDLRADGMEPEVYCSAPAAELIQRSGHSDFKVQMMRLGHGMFGYENEHSDRHKKEVDAGHFVVVVDSRDNETTDRIRDAFASHGGRFVNYYSSWTSRTLIP